MDIVFLTTEAVPFAKTGGLADVCGALPIELENRGHRVTVIMPAFRQIHEAGLPIEVTEISFAIPIIDRLIGGRLLRSTLPDSEVPVYFVDQPQYFDRPQLYGDASGDYRDNCERFAFFCRSAMQAIPHVAPHADLLHCNDWQTGLIPAYVATETRPASFNRRVATMMTIHNLAYQGQFWHWDMLLTGLDWQYFNSEQMEFFGHLNLLKTGLVFADAISTVSPRYAQEIQQPELGCALDGVLRGRSAALRGIINGVDYRRWDPAHDPHLAKPYDATNWAEGKRANRAALCEELGLPLAADGPLVGLVGRLADQKGWDLVIELMGNELQMDRPTQWVVLGTGEPRYQESLQKLSREHPERLAVHLGFSDRLAHRIEAASDMFMMPSRYEPCGLNQLYSLRYGAVPIVTPTGGLADTVVDATEAAIAEGTATGFHLSSYGVVPLSAALARAVGIYRDRPEVWGAIVRRGMEQDWSWARSAAQYEQFYAETLPRRKPVASPPPPRRMPAPTKPQTGAKWI